MINLNHHHHPLLVVLLTRKRRHQLALLQPDVCFPCPVPRLGFALLPEGFLQMGTHTISILFLSTVIVRLSSGTICLETKFLVQLFIWVV